MRLLWTTQSKSMDHRDAGRSHAPARRLGGWKSPAVLHHELKRFCYAGGLYAVTGLLAAAEMIASVPASHDTAALSDADGLIVLEPETCIGKPFPLTSHLSPEVLIQEGRWTILIHHHELSSLLRVGSIIRTAGSDRRIALVETPPYGEPTSTEKAALRTRLSDDREWFVQTPIEIQIDSGVVVSASLDLPAIAAEPSSTTITSNRSIGGAAMF